MLLSSDNLKRIDRAARGILERIGIRIRKKFFLDLLKASGAHVDLDEQIVRFPQDWLDTYLLKAPRQFTLHSRDGQNDVHMGSGKVHFANGGRVFRILDLQTGRYRRTLLSDVARTAALVNRLDHVHLYIITCQAHDLAPNYYHLNDFYHAMNHTRKHVMGGCDTFDGVRQMYDIASFVAGGETNLRKKPIVSVITNPVSPLVFNGETLDIYHFCATHGIPATCASAPIAGASAPATLAGTLCQMHAEALAGVALAQAFMPGAKVLYGAVPASMDLRNMEYAMGSVEMALLNAAAVRLAKLYQLPIYASAGVTDSKRPDIQSGVEKCLSNLMVAMNRPDLIHLAAGMLDSGNSISYEQFVIDNEIIAMISKALQEINVNADTLAGDVIEKVGPGGSYVMEEHTIHYMFEEFFYPELALRSNFDIWEQKGCPDMLGVASDRVRKLLNAGHGGLLEQEVGPQIKRHFPNIEIA
jgi:trimethylamine--corrinoid protein Co-methyltransferase